MDFQPIERAPEAFQQTVTADEVRAMCRRAFGEGVRVASAVELGTRTEGAVRRTGRATAKALERLGVDVDLAPVADVPGVPGSFIAAMDRSFSTRPARAAKDVTAFLMWAAEPHMEARKRIGLQVFIFLILLCGMLYFTKKKVWAAAH